MKKQNLVNMEEVNKLRAELEERFLNEKFNQNKVSDKTVKYSQYLDIPLAQEQRRRLEEFNKMRNIQKHALACGIE